MIELGRGYTAEQILEEMRKLAGTHPEHLKYKRAGESHDGREIPGILLGDSEKCLIVSGGIHGRESINPVLLLRMIEDYALVRENEYRDPGLEKGQQLLLNYSIYFLPLMNSDGYEAALRGFSEIRNPLLRSSSQKTRIPHEEWKENGKGIDINRNFPCESYLSRGRMAEAASEPETKALIHAFNEFPSSVGYIDFHSRGKVIYYYRSAMPWRYNRQAKRMAKHLQEVSGYAVGTRRDERNTPYDGGNSVNYYSETYKKLALTVETVEEEAAFPLDVSYQNGTYQEIQWIPLEFLKQYDRNL